jgi:uncharacterized membrane protein YfcA
LDISEIALLVAIFGFGGVVKGLLGIGLPALLVGLLTFFYEPRVAVTMILLTIMTTNIRQALTMILLTIMTTNIRQALVGGSVLAIVRRFWLYCGIAMSVIFFVAIAGQNVAVPVLSVFVGIAMSLFAVTSLFVRMPELPQKYDIPAQGAAGLGSGIMGGLTAIWGPPLAVYLMSLRLPRDYFIQVLGVLFAAQSIPLTLGFIVAGDLDRDLAPVALGALVPTFAGMFVGERLRQKINTQWFFRLFLMAFLLLGLNLIRRGVTGG